MPPPRNCTPLNPDRPNLLRHNAAIASAMKWPLLPWQEYALAGATEIDPATGTLFYDTVVITVQRQAGKTTIDAVNSVQNAMMGPDRHLWYTAQDGTHARDKFRQMEDTLEKSPVGGVGTGIVKKYLRGNGSELVKFINDSEWRPHAPTPESLHSKQADKATVDEAWAFTEQEGKDLLQALVAPFSSRRMLTGHRPQLWIPSAEGTVESTWFNPILDQLRDPRERPERTFFLDFGIPADVDPDDLAEVVKWHPGCGHLFDMSDLIGFRSQFGKDASGFARAFGNRRAGSGARVIPQNIWNDGRTVEAIPDGVPVGVGAAVGLDDADGAITMTGYHPTLGKITEVLDHRPGSAWMLLRLKEVQANAGRAVPVAIPPDGPSAHLHDQARRAGIPLIDGTNSSAYAAACPAVLSGLETGEWHFRTHPALEAAADLAARRWIQDGAWVWGRRASVGSIATLEAGSWSSWAVDHLPEDHGIQLFI